MIDRQIFDLTRMKANKQTMNDRENEGFVVSCNGKTDNNEHENNVRIIGTQRYWCCQKKKGIRKKREILTNETTNVFIQYDPAVSIMITITNVMRKKRRTENVIEMRLCYDQRYCFHRSILKMSGNSETNATKKEKTQTIDRTEEVSSNKAVGAYFKKNHQIEIELGIRVHKRVHS